jgi:hypothetical protein
VVFCDLPNIPAGPVGKFMITQMVAVAELEAGLSAPRQPLRRAGSAARSSAMPGSSEQSRSSGPR